MEYTQVEFLQLIQQYNSTDRRIIKANLKHIMDIYNIKPADIAALGYTSRNVYAWTNKSTKNIPLFEQALYISTRFNFSITEFIK